MRVVVVALSLGGGLGGCLTPFDDALLCIGVEDGSPCGQGTCRDGACCLGCWDGSTCHAGDLDTVCGLGGDVCIQCRSPTDACVENACAPSRRAIDLGAAGTVSCVVDDAGGLWCWGSNQFAGLGTGSADTESHETPQRVGADREWASVDAGQGYTTHACAIDRIGSLHCWGHGGSGELGQGLDPQPDNPENPATSDVPVEVLEPGPWASVTCGYAATCAIKQGGQLFCWGSNGENRIGFDSPTPSQPVSFPTERLFSQVSMHLAHTCAIAIDQSLSCWGENDLGQLGHQGDEIATVAPDTTWRSVSTGAWHTCGVRTGGTLWCWGGNRFGEVGQPASDMSFDLTQVDDATDWIEVSAGGTRGDPTYDAGHTCARKLDGRIFCFGDNRHGQLADGTTMSRHTPSEVLGDLRFAQIESGYNHVCAIGEDAVVYCWGDGGHKQNGTVHIDLTQPTAIALPPL